MSWACNPAVTSMILDSYQVAGPLFVQTLQTFFAAQCALTSDHLWPDDATKSVLQDPNYDFIVVGAGSAGAVVANRLSEVPDWKVLLVEAGGNPGLTTEVPQLFYSNMGTSLDWGYKTQPQNACKSYTTKGCAWPRGKVLGGSSSINGMFYVRANKADYDEWAANGNYGWSYDEILPYFMKSENFTGEFTEERSKYHGRDGPIHIVEATEPNPFEQLTIKAAVELGLKNLSDINGADEMGITACQSNIKDNYRYSTARAFLTTVKDRKNLHVMKNALVTKVLFHPGTKSVKGIQISKDGQDIIVNAKKEVILSGGAINSPQILMLSGIGPNQHLEDMDIEVIEDLPVGENLQDHVFSPILYAMEADENLTSIDAISSAFVQYILKGTGLLKNTSPHRVISFINTTHPDSSMPDIQHHHLVLPPGISNMIDVFEKHGFNDNIYQQFSELNKNHLVMLVFNIVLRPKSKGKIILKSKNPHEYPLIHANYFDDPEDIKTIIRSMRQYALRLGETKAFEATGLKLKWLKIESCEAFEKLSDEYLECIARELTFSLYHPTSTVKMGPKTDKAAVVDPELRVHNVKGLRVMDASIMPDIVRGNTNAPTIMIAEKGSDLIKEAWLSKHTEL
ncbi:unnamed protein product [Spodoptera littoralis]|uniref:Glucose-methanol-choline oxidoreductase N-terminal domain-containing protein n=1 Tax=Spodoptera littoralis TaxID=7109 RepID=A0A9P0N1J9_SPOLI|nr:unnamed protein product [Spodoptera littoralis]CAH1641202.1 unnamed protein product [Spodoptera littoralis]